ncbi:MAG: cupredoxin domain-containing protein [Candidatus Omnitrophota bacterium]|nr:cupredoxin domain-containing protein [Candidatus Omnitrophota bacterium]
MKKYFMTAIALFVVTFMNSYCFAANPIEEQHHKDLHHKGVKSENLELSGRVENGIRIIEIKASRYKFEPDPIVVKLGERVRLVVTATDVAHGLAIPEFKVNLSVAAGKTESIEFIVDKQGTFYGHCSVYCGPGHGHMHASFIVQ